MTRCNGGGERLSGLVRVQPRSRSLEAFEDALAGIQVWGAFPGTRIRLYVKERGFGVIEGICDPLCETLISH